MGDRALGAEAHVEEPAEERLRPPEESSVLTEAVAGLLEGALEKVPVPIPF